MRKYATYSMPVCI